MLVLLLGAFGLMGRATSRTSFTHSCFYGGYNEMVDILVKLKSLVSKMDKLISKA